MRDFIKQGLENLKYLMDVRGEVAQFMEESSDEEVKTSAASIGSILDDEIIKAADKLENLIKQTNTQYGSID